MSQLQKNLIQTTTLRTCDCDMFGAWTPSSILTSLQEIAAAHCVLLGIDYRSLVPYGVAWVISSVRVAFDRVPTLGESISIETWPATPRHFFFPRVCVFRDADGVQLGAAHSLWALMDMTTRKVASRDYVSARVPDNADRPLPIAMPRPVKPIDAPVKRADYAPVFTDFDINGHVNNTRYIDWCVNQLGMETMRDNVVGEFTVNFEAEIRPDTPIALTLAEKDDAFSCQGYAGEKRLFSIGGALRRRA